MSVINLRSPHNNVNDTVLGDPREVDRRLLHVTLNRDNAMAGL